MGGVMEAIFQAADYTGDGIVNIQDLTLFAEYWMAE